VLRTLFFMKGLLWYKTTTAKFSINFWNLQSTLFIAFFHDVSYIFALILKFRHVQMWSLGSCGLSVPVEIWPWNLAHRLRMSNEALEFFLGSGSFLVALEWGFKKTLWSLGSERLERDGKLKFCKSLIQYRASKFYSA
jgi:hypothetical protein